MPRAAVAGIVLAAGVSARSYWLTFLPRLQEATRLAASATAPTARANETPAPIGGGLAVTSDPSGAAVVVDGQPRGLTPITIEGLAAGTHAVSVMSAKGTVERSVVVSIGQTATVDASIYSGWLALFSPIEIQVFDGKRLLRLDDRNRVMLSPGQHDLRFSNRALGYEERRVVEMKPGEVTPLTVVPPNSGSTARSSARRQSSTGRSRLGPAKSSYAARGNIA